MIENTAPCKNCADLILRCLKAAKDNNMTVSFDGNFCSTLWSWKSARDYCTQCLPYINVLIGIEPYHLLDKKGHDYKEGISLEPDYEQQDEISRHFIA